MYKLIIEDDEGHTTVVPLVKDEITVGRKEGNTIRLTERNVSRHHARLTRANGSVFVEDLDSYNGVKVNGDKIAARTSMREGDLVEIGDYHLALQKAPDAEEPSAPKPPTPPTPPAPPAPSAPATQPPPIAAAEVKAVEEIPAPVEKPPALPTPSEGSVDTGRIRDIPEKEAGRLVIVNTELAGSEFPLVRTEMVIGRTEQNDIFISHRSISSNHAKIVFDGGIYRIIDLDSANGVLVNGEEYARVDLRRGDVIELGHLKIRYVAPGEDFQLGADLGQEQAGELSPPLQTAAMEPMLPKPAGIKKGGMLVVLIVAVGLVGPLAYFFTRTPETKDESVTPPVSTIDDSGKTADRPAAKFFHEGMEKLKHQDYDGAIAAFSVSLDKDPKYPGAQNMLNKAKSEKEFSDLLARSKTAIEKRDWDKAWGLIAQIGPESRFASEVETIKPEVRRRYVSFHLNRAKKFEESRLFDKALKHADSVLFVDEKNIIAAELKKSILQRLRESKKRSSNTVVARPTKDPQVKKEPVRRKKKDLAKIMDAAKALYQKDQFRDAVATFKKALQIDAKNCEALVGIGISFARMGKKDMAAVYYQKFVTVCPRDTRAPQARNALKQFKAYQENQ